MCHRVKIGKIVRTGNRILSLAIMGSKSPGLSKALSSVAEGPADALRPPVPPGIRSTCTSSHAQLNEMGVSPSKHESLRSQYIE